MFQSLTFTGLLAEAALILFAAVAVVAVSVAVGVL